MKIITVKYDENSKIVDISNNSLYFEQENESLQINAQINTDKLIRTYIKSANGNSNVTDAVENSEDVYSVVIEDKYMSKGTLYVGFEAYDDDGYIERYEPLKVYIDSFVSLGTDKNDNVYVVTADVSDVVTLSPNEPAYVKNVGNKKDIVLQFGIPQGIQGEKGEKGDTGEQGPQGIQGEQGPQGLPGTNGQDGKDGSDGYTPVKGVDYYTDNEIAEISKNIKEAVENMIVDTELSETSENPVQNKSVTKAIEDAKTEIKLQLDNKVELTNISNSISNNNLQLDDNIDVRLGELKVLTLCTPSEIDERYKSTFSFQSGETATTLTYSSTPLEWFGDDVTSGNFVPEPFSTYEVDIKNLGINGIRARVDKIAGYISTDVEGKVLRLDNSAGKVLRDYKIYGNSVQDGMPSADSPVEIQNVGDYNETTGKYDVPIAVGGKNLLNLENATKIGGTSFAVTDNVVTITDIGDSYGLTWMNKYIGLQGGQTYYFKTIPSSNVNSAAGWRINYTDGTNSGTKGYSAAITIPEDKEVKSVYLYIGWDLSHEEPITLKNIQIELGTTATEYEPFIEPVTTVISLDEPLRLVSDSADYIDYKNQKVVRNVEVLDDTGMLTIEESYSVMDSPVEEPMDLPVIDTNLYTNVISVGTQIQPSNVKVTYFKKG